MMQWIGIAFKRVLKNRLFLVTLCALAFCVIYFGSIEKEIKLPVTGVVQPEEGDTLAQDLYERLLADGMFPYETEAEMREDMRTGKISAGVLICRDLTGRLSSGEPDGVVTLLCTPTTSFIKFTGTRISAHLCDLYAPYLAAGILDSMGIPGDPQELRDYIDYCLENDAQFEFVFEDAEGKELEERSYAKSLIYGALAVLLFCLFALCMCTEKDISYRNMHDRIGCRRAFCTVLLPGYGVQLLLSMAVVGMATQICHWVYGTDIGFLWVQCAIYLLFLCGVSAALYAAVYRFSHVQLYVLAMSIISLAICPVFVNLSAYAAIPEWVKLLMPPYFFYKIPDAPWLCAGVAAAVAAAGLALLYLRESRMTPRTRI